MCPTLTEELAHSQGSIYQDARSDMEIFEKGLDKILSTVDLSTTELSPAEVDTSRKIRKKYGLEELCQTDDSSICLSRHSSSGRDHGQEIAILHSTLHLLTRRFLEELVSGGTVENEHPLLEPFLAVLEVMLWHGWQGSFLGRRSIWGLVRRTNSGAVENVRQWEGLKSSAGRVRAWIRLTIMNKTLATDLTHLINSEGALIAYEHHDVFNV
ncbi:hypothetical protein PSACC_02539 [Paramicrosporidium saccamoebae]|uniref:RUN domain-containing protein n=1 Tax=Paramicrosporidium saccamoebae TaxID=1246581 RepID=A0A2H9TIS5_9FUNG|nr:hypothetical protein PSACC_02539 [Paramicrosporidium saccamoebae]